MTDQECCLESQQVVRLNWKDQFRLRSSLQKTADGVTLMGTEICRTCGASWAYDGRGGAGADGHVYWYTPATPAMIERCDEVERALGEHGEHKDAGDPTVQHALDTLDAELRAARGARPWLRLVDQGPGAEWAAIGTWEPRPA